MVQPLLGNVTVNGETIPAAAIAAEAQNHHAPTGKPGIAWRKAARALAIRALLLQRARALRIATAPAELGQGRRETEEEALIRGLLEAEIASVAPGEDEVHARWAANPGRFRSPDLWEVSHILCAAAPADAAATEAARRRAEALLGAIRAEPRAFGRLARAESDCPSKENGGALGQIGPGDTVPEFEAALAGLAVGDLAAAPVRTRYGYHVIRLDARAEGRPLPYHVVRPSLAEAMEKAAWTRAARDYADRLIAEAEIAGVDLAAAV